MMAVGHASIMVSPENLIPNSTSTELVKELSASVIVMDMFSVLLLFAHAHNLKHAADVQLKGITGLQNLNLHLLEEDGECHAPVNVTIITHVTEIRLNISAMVLMFMANASRVQLMVKFIHRNPNLRESRTAIDTVASVFVTEVITVLVLEHTSAPNLPPPPQHHT